MASISIPLIQEGAYTDNRVLINPLTEEAMNSHCNCTFKIITPCAYVPNKQIRTIEDTTELCIPSWCKLIKAVKSIAGSSLLTTNGAGNITPALTATEKDALELTAKLVLG